MKKSIHKFLLAATLLLLIQPSYAVNLNVSYVHTENDYSFPASLVFDNESAGYSVTIGIPISNTWFFDISYADLGKASQTFNSTPTDFESTLGSIAIHGTTQVGSLGNHPIKIHGMAGIARSRAIMKVGTNSLTSTDNGLYVGAGFSLSLTADNAITAMVKDYDFTFSNGATFDYNPLTIEVGWTYTF